MPTRGRATQRPFNVAQLEQRMTLLTWLHRRLGYADTRALLKGMANVDEGFDADGRSYAHLRLRSQASQLDGVSVADLERYDANIRGALDAMNDGRREPITLRYFQYLAALYTEMFLDLRFNRPAVFLHSLNELVDDRNIRRTSADPVIDDFEEADLNKLAFWMATGSGKTLLLHMNYRQFLHYNRKPLDHIVLITPNEGLSEQHLAELAASNIRAKRFDLNDAGAFFDGSEVLKVTEITKLVMEKRGEGERVPVEAFEGNNLIFVDEGHKGSGGDAWRQVRDAIGETGFTFEYSATFGQALTAAKNDALTAEYGKAIGFDYSYRHFYNDGHGKDFNILNLEQAADDQADTLLLANLLSFYEQQRAFFDDNATARSYNLEQPLWALVGASVNAVYNENKRKRSDVLTAARFLHRVLSDPGWAVAVIARLLRGESGLLDQRGRDPFDGKFQSLHGREAAAVYADMLHRTLHAVAGGGLHIHDIKGAQGELGLKAAGAEHYFGLIYIGDTSAFKKLVEADDAGITWELDALSGSLFDGINQPGTTIEVLIGARKFMEGWNSWRVSNMGLLNIGRSEGAQIIQMFGRGVRLRGRGMALKRSAALPGSHPPAVKLLETLNIFALRANYMGQFREYLEREGVATDHAQAMLLPIRLRESFLKEGLVVPRVDESRDFKVEAEAVLEYEEAMRPVVLDVSTRAQRIESGAALDVMEASAGVERPIPAESLDLVDWNDVYLEIIRHSTLRGFENLAITPQRLRDILEADPPAYSLLAEERVTAPTTLADVERLQEIVVAILRKYADGLYRRRWARWESNHMAYVAIDADDPNLDFGPQGSQESGGYSLSLLSKEEVLVEQIGRLLADDATLYERETSELPRIHFDRHLYQPLLVNRDDRIATSPPGLNESEHRFVEDLRAYWKGRDARDGTKIFLLRNLSRGKGVGFFEESGFYPDFILWIKRGREQRIVFVEPHGMIHASAYRNDDKARLHEKLPALADSVTLPPKVTRVTLDSFVVSATPYDDLRKRYEDGTWRREQFARHHILFQEQPGDLAYIAALFAP